MDNKVKNITDNFSVALGLFDYINPIFYTLTSFIVLRSINGVISKPMFYIYAIGATISLIFGFTIPTVKFIVGLGVMKFKMPVNLVFYVNTGIFISGITMFTYTFKVNTIVSILLIVSVLIGLGLILKKTKKFNTTAVLIGTCGYLLLYISFLSLAIISKKYMNVLMFAIAICLFVYLCLVGIFSDLKNSRVHWAIEIANVMCQFIVAHSVIYLFA